MAKFISVKYDPKNILCKACTEACKQSDRVKIHKCPNYNPKEK